jgi:hypothetical protein
MTLPFEKSDNAKRKYLCFVCAKPHIDFESFKEHILKTHDEGREFVVCPLERCGAPVRDVKLHFKAHHSTEPMPKTGPMKAMIWKDLRDGKAKTRKPNFREGYFLSNKMNKEFKYRSGMECAFYECLEAIPEVIGYDVEPLKIPYLFEGQSHNYFPDIMIKFSTGETEIWEVKPASQTSLPLNEAKWSAATIYCKARNWEFIVMTEQALSKLKKRARLNRQQG